jgi:hypothetical protein
MSTLYINMYLLHNADSFLIQNQGIQDLVEHNKMMDHTTKLHIIFK